MDQEVQRRPHHKLQLLLSSAARIPSWPSDHKSLVLSDPSTPHQSHYSDLQLSISLTRPCLRASVGPTTTPPAASIGKLRCTGGGEGNRAEAVKWEAAEQIRLAAMEKACAERVRELARKEMELARASHVWEKAREEVERAERLKERATRALVTEGTCMEITCHSCRQSVVVKQRRSKAKRLYCMRTWDRYVLHLDEWFVKQSMPLMRLTSLIPLNGSAPLPNPNPIDLPQGLNYHALIAIIIWCEHNRYSPLEGEEWRWWEFEFYRKHEVIIEDIDAGIESLEIHAMRLSLDQHIARVAGEDVPAPVKRRLEVHALEVRMSCGRKRSKRRSRLYCCPGPSKLRNMTMSVDHHKPAEA